MIEPSSLPIGTSATGVAARARLAVVVVAILGATAVSSCSGGSAARIPASDRPTTEAALAPNPPSAVKPTARQRAGEAAVAQAVRYERLVDELTIHSELPLDRLYAVSTQPNVTDEIAFLGRFRSSGDRQVGRIRVVSTRVERLELRSRRPGTIPSASVSACLDVSAVRAFDANGTSIVPKSRKPYYVLHLRLINRKYPHRRTWLVRTVSATEVHSCAA